MLRGIWHDGISHQFWFRDLEMMSAACIPVVGIIKKKRGGSEFPELFFFFTPLAFRRRCAEIFEIQIGGETENSEHMLSFQILCAKFPVQPCLKIAFRPIIYSHLKGGGRKKNKKKRLSWCDLWSYFRRHCVIWEHRHARWRRRAADYLNLSAVWLLFGKVNRTPP